jgi:hypothetical protein
MSYDKKKERVAGLGESKGENFCSFWSVMIGEFCEIRILIPEF